MEANCIALVDKGLLGLLHFHFCRKEVAQRRMQSLLVAEGDVAAQGLPKLSVIGEGLATRLVLHRYEERFDVGVVVHLASPVHALQLPQPGAFIAKLKGGVLETQIAFEQPARPRDAIARRLQPCPAGQGRVGLMAHASRSR